VQEQIEFSSSANSIELDHLIDRLSARLGRARITRLLALDSHTPELASSTVSAQRAADLGWDAFRRFRSDAGLNARPLRLLPNPEPIHDVLALVPDGPPVRFRWRRAWHDVIAVEGPERIQGAWWNEDSGGPTRDYFRVEDKTGLRFWLFRAGLYHEMTVAAPRWFLHGMYA
jgi:protein ImuB